MPTLVLEALGLTRCKEIKMAGTMMNSGGASGSTKVIRMPIKTVEIKLDEIGYEGWVATLRTNPRAEYYDMFLSTDEEESWKGFGHILVSWNFGDEDGNPLELPPTLNHAKLPYDVQGYLIRHYIDAFNEAAGVPKGPQNNSENSSPTSANPQTVDSK